MMSRHAAVLFCALGVAVFIAIPRTSRAEDDATIEMARQRFREGVQFYDQHQFEKARLAFLQAYALKPHPAVLLNLAQSELRSGHPDDAATHFSQYMHAAGSSTDAERQEANAGYNIAKSRVGEVSLTVDASGAQVLVDNADKGTTPLADPLYVLPGSHTIEARSGDRKASKSVTLSAGQSVTVAISLHGSIAAAGAPTAAETPPAETPETTEPPPGPAEETTPPPAPPTPPEPAAPAHAEGSTQGFFEWFGAKPGAWVLTGVGVVGVGVGVTMALVASHDYSNAKSLEDQILEQWQKPDAKGITDEQKANGAKPCSLTSDATKSIGTSRSADYVAACDQYKSRADSGDSAKTVAIVSSIVGGAALVGTVVYYFVDRKSEPASQAGNRSSGKSGFSAHVAPLAGYGQAGVAIFGTF
jgi:hypothetical protein